GAGLVQHNAERIEVRRGRAWSFGRDVAFRADECAAFAMRRHQTDVRQLRAAIHKDDVTGLDIAVDEIVEVELSEATHHVERKAEAVGGGKAAQALEVGAESVGSVI